MTYVPGGVWALVKYTLVSTHPSGVPLDTHVYVCAEKLTNQRLPSHAEVLVSGLTKDEAEAMVKLVPEKDRLNTVLKFRKS